MQFYYKAIFPVPRNCLTTHESVVFFICDTSPGRSRQQLCRCFYAVAIGAAPPPFPEIVFELTNLIMFLNCIN